MADDNVPEVALDAWFTYQPPARFVGSKPDNVAIAAVRHAFLSGWMEGAKQRPGGRQSPVEKWGLV